VLFYANARLAREGLRALATRKQARCVVLDLEESETLDVTAVESLAALVDDLTGRGIELRLARVRSPALDLIRRSGVADAIGMERIFSTIPSATADFDGSGDP
jgi:SulP family sulfate permease